MAGKYLLDTNIVIAMLDSVPSVMNAVEHAQEVFLSSTVVGELYFGAFKSRRIGENLAKLEDFLDSVAILPCDKHTAMQFGKTKSQLSLSGRPIPDNDIWIAAVAQQHGLVVVTRDAHFTHIANLLCKKW